MPITTPRLLAFLLLAMSWAPAAARDVRRSGDIDSYGKVRELFFHEARPDPLRQKYEELFREPWPEEGFHQHKPFRPFADVKKFNDAFELKGVSGARVETMDGPRAVILSVQLPGSAGRAVNVRADEEKVVLAFPASVSPRRYRVHREEEQVMGLPEGADPDTARVRREGDTILVSFDKKSAAREQAQASSDQ